MYSRIQRINSILRFMFSPSTPLLQLRPCEGDHVGIELVGQPDDHVDVAVPSQVRVVLVGPLQEYLVRELLQSLVGFQCLTHGDVRLLEGLRGLMMAPPGQRSLSDGHGAPPTTSSYRASSGLHLVVHETVTHSPDQDVLLRPDSQLVLDAAEPVPYGHGAVALGIGDLLI